MLIHGIRGRLEHLPKTGQEAAESACPLCILSFCLATMNLLGLLAWEHGTFPAVYALFPTLKSRRHAHSQGSFPWRWADKHALEL